MFKQSLKRRFQRREANRRYKLAHPKRYKASQKKYWIKNIETIRKKQKERMQKFRKENPVLARKIWNMSYRLPSTQKWIKDNKQRLNKYRKEWRKNNRLRMNIAGSKWKKKNIEKVRCHKKVKNAIDRGELIKQPCKICGNKIVHAHHHNYSKPLDVKWLCNIHHKKLHAQLRKIKP